MNDSRQMVAVWISNSQCQAATALFGESWSAPTALSSAMILAASFPSVKINAAGEAVAGWSGSLSSTNQSGVFVATLPFGMTWSAPIPLALDPFLQKVSLSICTTGHVVAAVESSGPAKGLQIYRAFFGGSWSPPLQLAGNKTASQSQLGFRENEHIGLIAVAWIALSGTKQAVFAELLSHHEALPSALSIYGSQLSDDGQHAQSPQIAHNLSREATVIWSRSNGTNTIIQASTKTKGGKWSDAEDLSLPGQHADSPQIAMNRSGQRVALWRRSDGTNTVIQAVTKLSGASWSAPVTLSLPGQSASLPKIALNDAGQAVAIWKRSNGSNDIIQASTMTWGESWSAPSNLSTAGQNSDLPSVAINAKGQCAAIWQSSNGMATSIQSATTQAAPLPPLSVRLFTKLITSPQENYYHLYVHWLPCSNPNLASYNIYRNGALVATQGADLLFFQDVVAQSSLPVTYEVSSVATGGGESPRAAVTLQ